MIKAIIFDMDGLLINSEPVWFRARKELLEEINIEWKWSDQKNTMGLSTQAWLTFMHNKIKGVLNREDLLNGIIERMKWFYGHGEIEIMPGANEALGYAKKNFMVGLASGSYKELLYSAVKVNKWENIFDEILSSDDMERGKPYPDIYIETAKRLGVEPSESIVLEDSRDGIKAGVSAGAKVIAVPSKEVVIPEETLNSAADVIDTLFHFPISLNKLNKE